MNKEQHILQYIIKQVEDTLSPRSSDGRYSPAKVQFIVDKALEETPFDELKTLLIEADGQGVKYLVNAIARCLVGKDKSLIRAIIEGKADSIPAHLHTYLNKHIKLSAKESQYEELSVADVVEDPKAKIYVEDLEHNEYWRTDHAASGFSVKFCSYQLTSLYGLDLLERVAHCSKIVSLGLNAQMCLAIDEDPDLSGQSPFKNFTNLLSLHIIISHITSQHLFRGLEKLEQLSIDHLDYIAADSFDLLQNLEELEIANGSLDSLPSTLFKKLSKLKKLCIKGLEFSTLPLGLLSNLTNLEELSLFQNLKFKRLIAGQFEGLSSLRSLEIVYCWIENIENGSFRGLEKLESLNLHQNALVEIKKGMFDELLNLKQFLFGYNFTLKAIEVGAFKNLKNLAFFELVCHALTTLDPGIFEGLTSLKELCICCPQRITNNFFNDSFSSLEILRIKASFSKNATNPFAKLSQLKRLDLENSEFNQLNLSDFFKGLSILEMLNVEKPYFKNGSIFNLGSINNLHNLKVFYLGNSDPISCKDFEGLPHLKKFYLYNTGITDFSVKAFERMLLLEKVVFGENTIDENVQKTIEKYFENKECFLSVCNEGIDWRELV
jgi:Leucine-rich repeat (LRR) protein